MTLTDVLEAMRLVPNTTAFRENWPPADEIYLCRTQLCMRAAEWRASYEDMTATDWTVEYHVAYHAQATLVLPCEASHA